MSWLQRLRAILAKTRKYSSFWEWPDKEVKERGIVRDWIAATAQNELTGVASTDRDPPDCIAHDGDGGTVGIEVTELVDQRAVEMNERATCLEDRVYCAWTLQSVTERIEEIIRHKDSKAVHGGPYARLVLVIHCDEPIVVSPCFPLDALGQHVFSQPERITEVYLLLSYRPDPPRQGYYPCVRFRLGKGEDESQLDGQP